MKLLKKIGESSENDSDSEPQVKGDGENNNKANELQDKIENIHNNDNSNMNNDT